MVSQVIKDRIKNSIGKEAKIFLDNGYSYYGIITNCDDIYVELVSTGKIKIVNLNDIHDATIREIITFKKGETKHE
jgi:sRNA-binding regulator protein Hfq